MKSIALLVLVLLGLFAMAGSVQAATEDEDLAEDGDIPILSGQVVSDLVVTEVEEMAEVDYMAKADAFLMSLPEKNLLLMDMQEVIDAVDAGDESMVIVDVRPASLYDAGHIEGSINVPFPELVPNMDMVPTDKKIAVVCTYDTNSAFAVSVMTIFGDREAWVVVGGVPAWEEAGRELVPSEEIFLVGELVSNLTVAEADEIAEEHIAKADAFLMSLPEKNLLLMDMQEVIDAVDAGDESMVIVDVRPASAYDAGHIPDSINVPFPELVPNMDMVPTDKKVAVVCTYDTNSAFAVSVMSIIGDRDAWVVVGGVPAWEEAGRELVATEE